MSVYAVIDTNVIVSSLLTENDDSATVRVVRKVFSGEIIPVYCDLMTKEYRDVLHRKKFGFSDEVVDYLISAIEKFGLAVETEPSGLTLPDMKDLPFYETALKINRTEDNVYLVTGNKKHFPQSAFLVSPRELLVALNE